MRTSQCQQRTLAVIIAATLIYVAGCGTSVLVPEPQSESYASAVKSFYVGLAALEVGDDRRAREELERTVELAAVEPAAWNNLGILYLRQRELDRAKTSLDKAGILAPENASIALNRAVLAGQMGDSAGAVELLTRTVDLDPADLHALYLLAQEHERQTEDAAAFEIYGRILRTRPNNVAARLESARLAAKLGQMDELRSAVAPLEKASSKFSPEARELYVALRSAVQASAPDSATRISYLRNVLLREPWFRNDLSEFQPSETSIGRLMRRPLILAVPEFKPAPPDRDIRFEAQPADEAAGFAIPFFYNGDDAPVTLRAGENGLAVGDERLPVQAEDPRQLAAIDHDYDFRNDIAVGARSGFKLFRQIDDRRFRDVTAAAGLPADILTHSYSGIWPLDVEHDGDLDLLLARESGPPVVLRNNSDGTFIPLSPFDGVENVRDLVYADLDEDGDADAAFLTADGMLRFASNERGGTFRLLDRPQATGVKAIAVGDIDGDGRLDLVSVQSESIWATNLNPADQSSEMRRVGPIGSDVCRAECMILIADLDNNGAADIVLAGGDSAHVLHGSSEGPLAGTHSVPGRISGVAEFDGDGKLDLVGVTTDGRPAVFKNQAANNYHWQVLRPRAAKTEGDQRVNSFGIGGEVEVRSGLLAQKRLIASPQVHFGLGEQPSADVLRVIWGNGYVQAEFDLKADQAIAAEQRLKGSCPHLFAWDGEKFALVKDAPPWSPALGLKINAQDTYGILQTEEWFKVPGESLKPKDGHYELRITGEYWESFYLDHYRLLAVDHPVDTEAFTDERFAIPLPPLKVFTTGHRRAFTSATDHNDRDVAAAIAALDEKYLDGIERGRFQGVARDHWVELELPAEAPRDKKLWLVGDGWVHPTDASINVQRGQGNPTPPRSLSLEVQAADGSWQTAKADLGFPAGKMKSILIDLVGVFPKGAKTRKLRLRTEMEIFWDRLAWAVDQGNVNITEHKLALASADLRYRGFSVVEKADDSSPEKPDYDRILTTAPRWRDLEGYYTRFGDVRELLAGVDGRMVLMNAGDELILRFPELPAVRPGWKRDFVIIGNGWIKDGDLNSVFSKTLLPLPTHASNDYSVPPDRLEDDPIFHKHRRDWVDYHTRYIGTEGFRDAIRSAPQIGAILPFRPFFANN